MFIESPLPPHTRVGYRFKTKPGRCRPEWQKAHHLPHPRPGHRDYCPEYSCSEHMGLMLSSKPEAVHCARDIHRAA